MKFSAEYRVDSHDTDINGVASASSIMRYMQETATLQHERFGPTVGDLRGEGKAFILSRASLDVLSTLKAQDVITVESWLYSAKGFGFTRNCEIKKDGSTAAVMSSFWGMVDVSSFKPIRADGISLGFGTCEEEIKTVAPQRAGIPVGVVMSEIGTRTVKYSDCDMNLHLNNTKYPGVFCDFLDMNGKFVSGFSVNYRKDAKLGKSFTVFHGEDICGTHYFRTLLDCGEVGTEAIITLSDIKTV